jgi:hypothetical protein
LTYFKQPTSGQKTEGTLHSRGRSREIHRRVFSYDRELNVRLLQAGLHPAKRNLAGMSYIERQRRVLHEALCSSVLGTKGAGTTPSMADKDSRVSVQISTHLLSELRRLRLHPRSGVTDQAQTLGNDFDLQVSRYLEHAFLVGMRPLRPGSFVVRRGVHIRDTAQYAHLEYLRQIGEDPEVTTSVVARNQFRAVTASDYQVQADIVILRKPETVPRTPRGALLRTAGSGAATSTPLLRNAANDPPILHANISCKWTFRSDRAQNIRTEAMALMRHRKGPMPQMVVVTAEPMPSRLRSIAIGTGEVDCVYHVAFNELAKALEVSMAEAESWRGRKRSARVKALTDQLTYFELMRDGDRLRDISDLPFDLAI